MTLTPLKDCDLIKRFVQPPADPPEGVRKQPGGITTFPQAPLEMPPETFTNTMNRREQNRKELLRWIKDNLKPDIDYGRVHLDEHCRFARAGSSHLCSEFSHWSRPMLFKAGAERIAGVLGLTAHFPNLSNYELACVHRQEVQSVILKCELRTSNGTVVAHGAGARHVRQDNWKLNTSIKMAVKSALVDAIIRVAGLSGVFITRHRQTLTRMGVCHDSVPDRSLCNQNGLPKGSNCHHQPEKPMSSKQKQLIKHVAGKKGFTTDAMEKQCQSQFHKPLNDLDRVQASRFINHLINNNG